MKNEFDWIDENFDNLMEKFVADRSPNKPDWNAYCSREYQEIMIESADARRKEE